MASEIELRTLELLAAGGKYTRGELCSALGLHPSAETTSRVRALRGNGFEIKIERESVPDTKRGRKITLYRYYLREDQRDLAVRFIAMARSSAA